MKFEIAIDTDDLTVHKQLASILFNLLYPYGFGEVWGKQKLVEISVISTSAIEHDPDIIQQFVTLWGTLRGVDVICTYVSDVKSGEDADG